MPRYHPPSEDFNECKAKLKWAELRVVDLVAKVERLEADLQRANDTIADIQDDTDGEKHAN